MLALNEGSSRFADETRARVAVGHSTCLAPHSQPTHRETPRSLRWRIGYACRTHDAQMPTLVTGCSPVGLFWRAKAFIWTVSVHART